MKSSLAGYLEALAWVALITAAGALGRPLIGLASAALLYLVPVLISAVRGGSGPAIFSALSGTLAYNFFLLPPLYTFRVHAPENLVSVVVLTAVALVTGRLATQLKGQKDAALAREVASREAEAFAAGLAATPRDQLVAEGLRRLGAYGRQVRLIEGGESLEGDPAFSPTDQSAAAWCFQNGAPTGPGTQVLPTSDWTFFPTAPRGRPSSRLVAVDLMPDGEDVKPGQIEHLARLCETFGGLLDRSELEAERQRRELLDQAEQLSRSLLASLAHDFRTPLTVVIGHLEVLSQETPLAGEALDLARRLDRTMDDLLGLARIEAGGIRPSLDSLDVVDVVDYALSDLPTHEGIAMDRRIPADLPFIQSDPILLHHILGNLLRNALRHARSSVCISAWRGDGGIMLSVDDDGPGVSPKDRGRIFEPFVHIEAETDTSTTGLGLAIVKGFADVMGVEVEVGDSVSGGASFRLRLPVAPESSR
jgi:two-component system sensor histidine kinase KdpD